MSANRHKSNLTRIGVLRGEIAHLESKPQTDAVRLRIEKLRREINSLQHRGIADRITVSEHALVQYVHRVIGIKPEELEERVLPAAMRDGVLASGATEVPVGGTHRCKLVNGVVVTVVPLSGGGEDQ